MAEPRHAYTTELYCALPSFICLLGLCTVQYVSRSIHSHMNESSQKQNAYAHYQESAKGICIYTRFSGGGGKQLLVVRNL